MIQPEQSEGSIQDLSELSVDELCDQFVVNTRSVTAAYKRLGIVYYYLGEKLGKNRGCRNSPTIYGVLTGRGVTKGTISNASIVSRAYADVVSGSLERSEFDLMTYDVIYHRYCKHRPGSRGAMGLTLHRYSQPSVVNEPRAAIPVCDDSLDDDEPKTIEHMRKALAAAQEWLIEARSCMPKGSPEWWDLRIAGALKQIGELRFGLKGLE